MSRYVFVVNLFILLKWSLMAHVRVNWHKAYTQGCQLLCCTLRVLWILCDYVLFFCLWTSTSYKILPWVMELFWYELGLFLFLFRHKIFARGISCHCVSVLVSDCHNSSFCQNGSRDQTHFWHGGFLQHHHHVFFINSCQTQLISRIIQSKKKVTAKLIKRDVNIVISTG